MAGRHNTFREGILAGFLSATVIVVWLLIVDLVARHAFYTPSVLGKALLSVAGIRVGDTEFTYVAIYTVFHYAAFFGIGIIVASIVHAARKTPAILAGFLMLFVAFEIGFYGLTGMLSVGTQLQGLAWYQIMIANLIASVVMLGFMWKRHPELTRQFNAALEGTDA